MKRYRNLIRFLGRKFDGVSGQENFQLSLKEKNQPTSQTSPSRHPPAPPAEFTATSAAASDWHHHPHIRQCPPSHGHHHLDLDTSKASEEGNLCRSFLVAYTCFCFVDLDPRRRRPVTGFLMENRPKRRHEQPFHVLVQLVEVKRLKRPLYIPLDIVYDILLRLPVKTLSRFCCVSKPWRSIISAPNFRIDHISLSQQRPLLLVINGNKNDTLVHFTTFSSEGSRLREFSSDRIPKYPLPGIEYPPRFRIIQSCLGLVCLEVGCDASIRLCNPSTEKIITLPYPLDQGLEMCAGFGYAASTKEFKVVRFYTPTSNDEEIHCEIFPLGTTSGGWREARSPPFMPLLDSRVPLLHGALHLMPTGFPQSEEDHYIAAFDLDTEEYRGIELPEIYFHEALEPECYQLAVLRGSLYLVLDFVETKKTLELWLLKDYHGGEWVRQYNIDLSSIDYFSASLVEIMGDGSILLNVRGFGRKELLCYNSQQNCFVEKKGVNCDATFYFETCWALESC